MHSVEAKMLLGGLEVLLPCLLSFLSVNAMEGKTFQGRFTGNVFSLSIDGYPYWAWKFVVV